MAEVLQFPEAVQANQQLSLAVGAEALSEIPWVLPLADVVPIRTEDLEVSEPFCVAVDSIPHIGELRQQARGEAERILERNRQRVRDGDFSGVPLDVDAVGTAAKVAAVENHFGKNSTEHIIARSGLVRDCSRKWAEAFRKNTYEYFEPTVQKYDEETDKLYADGLCVDEMLQNGLSPVTEREEAELRINDYVSLVTNKLLLTQETAQSYDVVRVTQCPDWAIRSLRENPKSAHGGYAPEIEKLMVHFDWFDADTKCIYHEQAGISGKYIDNNVINEAYEQLGFIEKGQHLDKTEVHALTGLAPKGTIEGVLNFIKILDTVASERSGLSIFMGEAVGIDHPKNYLAILEESASRRAQQHELSEKLANYLEQLYRDNVDRAAATVMVENYIQDEMLSRAEKNPDLAEVVFNKETADGFRKAQWLATNGFYEEAVLQRDLVRQNAPAASSCGAGSCGLEAFDPNKSQDKKAQELLDVQSGETVLRDTERMCTDCGERSVYYAYTKNKVKKACTNCEKTENVARNHNNQHTTKKAFGFLTDKKPKQLFAQERSVS